MSIIYHCNSNLGGSSSSPILNLYNLLEILIILTPLISSPFIEEAPRSVKDVKVLIGKRMIINLSLYHS